jgi:hypothetical protein
MLHKHQKRTHNDIIPREYKTKCLIGLHSMPYPLKEAFLQFIIQVILYNCQNKL